MVASPTDKRDHIPTLDFPSARKTRITAMTEPFELEVEDLFHITGRGYVVTGKIGRGRVKVGDKLVVKASGGEQPCTVTGIQVGKGLVDEAGAGTDAGLMLRGFDPKKLKDATGVAIWGSSSRGVVTVRQADSASPANDAIEASIAKMRGEKKPWWKLW